MIGKLIQGTDFQGCLSYVLGKPGADRLGGIAVGNTVEELTAQFEQMRSLRPTLQRAAYHLSLSLSPGEHLEDADWEALADEYLKRLGVTSTNYLVVRHTDTNRDHIHIVASRIRFDGTAIDDAWDYTRSQVILRDLEQKYGLVAVPSSHSTARRAPTRRQLEKEKQTGAETAKATLQKTIDAVIPQSATIADLRGKLEAQGVETRLTYSKNGIPKGISFSHEGVALAGHQLGRSYSLTMLRQRLPVPDRIEPQLPVVDQALAIQTAIDASSATSLSEFIGELQTQGIRVDLKTKHSGRRSRQANRVSYAIGAVGFLDADLGEEYTLQALRRRQFAEEDFSISPVESISPEALNAEQPANLARSLYEFLARSLQSEKQAKSITFSFRHVKNVLTLTQQKFFALLASKQE